MLSGKQETSTASTAHQLNHHGRQKAEAINRLWTSLNGKLFISIHILFSVRSFSSPFAILFAHKDVPRKLSIQRYSRGVEKWQRTKHTHLFSIYLIRLVSIHTLTWAIVSLALFVNRMRSLHAMRFLSSHSLSICVAVWWVDGTSNLQHYNLHQQPKQIENYVSWMLQMPHWPASIKALVFFLYICLYSIYVRSRAEDAQLLGLYVLLSHLLFRYVIFRCLRWPRHSAGSIHFNLTTSDAFIIT